MGNINVLSISELDLVLQGHISISIDIFKINYIPRTFCNRDLFMVAPIVCEGIVPLFCCVSLNIFSSFATIPLY